MKKFPLLLAGSTAIASFAQNDSSLNTLTQTTLTNSSAGMSSLGLGILGVLVGVFFYIALPVLFYCISSYSLSLLNKYYGKKSSSRISWIPFVRYYDLVKTATKSPTKAFFITLLPWIMTLGGILGGIAIGIIEKNIDIGSRGWTGPAFITFGVIILLGVLGIGAMNFWRAFIIAKYIKGDTTTALGLSTYTSLVLWYAALDRVYKKTNIIGILGFVLLGLVLCFYAGILIVMGPAGIAAYLGA